ncbi:hypothetical protein NPIL_644271 [Nephila pilipes]|uniref:Uncharacterized protein n=1 Tax=Nephila pilipes TaxID=299642 RepID=A0A8X6NMH1_NEPPI|nr:hypothetical protein NPIL_644271 [Nephila pilipes]
MCRILVLTEDQDLWYCRNLQMEVDESVLCPLASFYDDQFCAANFMPSMVKFNTRLGLYLLHPVAIILETRGSSLRLSRYCAGGFIDPDDIRSQIAKPLQSVIALGELKSLQQERFDLYLEMTV